MPGHARAERGTGKNLSERAMLRICWFTNVPFPKGCELVGRPIPFNEGWTSSLAAALVATGQVQLLVITAVVGKGGTVTDTDGTTHMLVGLDAKQFAREVLSYPGAALRRKYLEIIAGFEPQVVHIHGSEYGYGLMVAEQDIAIPTVISLQGFLGACYRDDSAGIPLHERLRNCGVQGMLSPASVLRGTSIPPRKLGDEMRILRNPCVFTGRTLFDRAYLHSANPSARYCHCDETLRREFFLQERDPIRILPHSIFAASSNHPRKGFHCLLAAVALLQKEFPEITVRVPGRKPRHSWRAGWYERYVRKLISRWGLEDRIAFLGNLSAEGMAAELAQAHVFGYPSFVDNSPNALAEAMLVGVPIATSYVGGIPSLVRDQESALCFPVGDAISMAECIRILFQNRERAQHLAGNARKIALARHDPGRVAGKMLEVYRQVLGGGL